MVLLEAHHVLHVSRIRVKGRKIQVLANLRKRTVENKNEDVLLVKCVCVCSRYSIVCVVTRLQALRLQLRVRGSIPSRGKIVLFYKATAIGRLTNQATVQRILVTCS